MFCLCVHRADKPLDLPARCLRLNISCSTRNVHVGREENDGDGTGLAVRYRHG